IGPMESAKAASATLPDSVGVSRIQGKWNRSDAGHTRRQDIARGAAVVTYDARPINKPRQEESRRRFQPSPSERHTGHFAPAARLDVEKGCRRETAKRRPKLRIALEQQIGCCCEGDASCNKSRLATIRPNRSHCFARR